MCLCPWWILSALCLLTCQTWQLWDESGLCCVSGFKGELSLSDAVNCLYCFFIIISFVSYYLSLVQIHKIYLELVQNLHVIHTCILFSTTGIWNWTFFGLKICMSFTHAYSSTTGIWNCTNFFVCLLPVNSVCFAPHELGLILACGSSDGSISIISTTGMQAALVCSSPAETFGTKAFIWHSPIEQV